MVGAPNEDTEMIGLRPSGLFHSVSAGSVVMPWSLRSLRMMNITELLRVSTGISTRPLRP